MAAHGVNYLKGSNRNFDNILDSYLNLVDGGAITGAVTFAGNQTLGDAITDTQFTKTLISLKT